MLNEIDFDYMDLESQKKSYGKGVELGMGLVTAFGIIAIITVVCYKLFKSKSGNVTLPGGFKFKFTT